MTVGTSDAIAATRAVASATVSTGAPTHAALMGLFTGDALAMPVHWYYRPSDILRDFPPRGITRMQAAPEVHPSSIMSLHSTSAAGRSTSATGRAGRREIIGDVILKGRRDRWGVAGAHYHCGMPAGENTLNAWCARWLIEHLTEAGGYRPAEWFAVYAERMTADPPAHPDTYAESYHRGFFANLVAGKPLMECGVVSHDTPSMGAMVTVFPVALALLPSTPLREVQSVCREHVSVTHPDEQLLRVVDACVVLIDELLGIQADTGLDDETRGSHQRDALVTAARAVGGTRLDALLDIADKRSIGDAEVVGGRYSLACYIEDSWPSVCWLAARHGHDPAKAQLINANLGGENAHRGAVLGALSGLMSGQPSAELVLQLHRRQDLEACVDGFVQRFAA